MRYHNSLITCCHNVSFYFEVPKKIYSTLLKINKNINKTKHEQDNTSLTIDTSIMELDVAAEERAKEMIIQGYSSGELNYCYNGSTEIRGWWAIDNN